VGWCGAGWRPHGAARGARRPWRRMCAPSVGPNRSTCRKITYSSRTDTPRSCSSSDPRWSATQAQLLAPRTAADFPDHHRSTPAAPTYRPAGGRAVPPAHRIATRQCAAPPWRSVEVSKPRHEGAGTHDHHNHHTPPDP
jgi:hypothetical protein